METRNMPPLETSTSNSAGNNFEHDHNKNENRAHIDPRMMLELLESLRKLMKKMNYEESMEVFNKLKVGIRKKVKNQTTMKRSLSVGDEMKNEKFKIKTPHVVIVARPNGENGQDNKKSNNFG